MDWTVASALATGAGTLVLAVATFLAVRSSNRSARIAERALMAGLRPLLSASRYDDTVQKIPFIDGHHSVVSGGRAAADVTDGAIYLVLSVRNAGSGLAVEHGWSVVVDVDPNTPHADPADFHRLTRDIFIAPGDVGFWQGALRDPSTEEFVMLRDCIESRRRFVIDLLYGDQDGGQRVITRFSITPYDQGWLAGVARHWFLDRPQPR